MWRKSKSGNLLITAWQQFPAPCSLKFPGLDWISNSMLKYNEVQMSSTAEDKEFVPH